MEKQYGTMVLFLQFYVVAITAFLAGCVLFFGFSADDAYIVLRYAENLAYRGEAVFNPGERLCAFTSPLHVLLDAVLFTVTRHVLTVYKILSLCLVIFSGIWVLRKCPDACSRFFIMVTVLLSPCVILWTFGGLETPLLLFLTTAIAILSMNDKLSSSRLTAICFLSGLAFITRYDSVVFNGPVLLWAFYKAKNAGKLKLAGAVVAAAVFPALWLLISYMYYGNIFPTSFYAKTPSVKPSVLFANIWYVTQFFFFTPFIPFLLFFLFTINPSKRTYFIKKAWAICLRYWGIFLGCCFYLLYSFTMATTHMMFCFRSWVPFLLSFVLLAAVIIFETRELWLCTHAIAKKYYALCCIIILMQVLHAYYIYTYSLDSFATNGECRGMGAADMIAINKKLFLAAKEIEKDWLRFGNPAERPTVFTIGEGIIPFVLKNADCYGTLIWKKASTRNKKKAFDYFVLFDLNGQSRKKGYKKIASYILIEGEKATLDIFSSTRCRSPFLR